MIVKLLLSDFDLIKTFGVKIFILYNNLLSSLPNRRFRQSTLLERQSNENHFRKHMQIHTL